MKSTPAAGGISLGVLIVWLWNSAIPAFAGVAAWWPEMPAEVAAVVAAIAMALGARYLDKAD